MIGRGLQTFFMLVITIAVAVVFITKVPQPESEVIQDLQNQVAAYRATIDYYENLPSPTLIPTQTPFPTANILPTSTPPQINFVTRTPDPYAPPIPTAANPNPESTLEGTPAEPSRFPRIITVQTSTQVNNAGCAVEAGNVFSTTDTIYGIGTFANMSEGDQIRVKFMYLEQSQVVYQESFFVEIPGDFCRWYVVEPDEFGWDLGRYSLSYQVNEQPLVTVNYTIDAMSEDEGN